MSLLIGQYVYSVLANDPAVIRAFGTQIFAMVAREGAEAPYLIYTPGDVRAEWTKDGRSVEESDVSITVVSKTLQMAEQYAHLVRGVMERVRVALPMTPVQECTMQGAQHEYDDDLGVFGVTCTYTFKEYE